MTQYTAHTRDNNAAYAKSVSEGPTELRARTSNFTAASSSGENGRVGLVVEAGRTKGLTQVAVEPVKVQVGALGSVLWLHWTESPLIGTGQGVMALGSVMWVHRSASRTEASLSCCKCRRCRLQVPVLQAVMPPCLVHSLSAGACKRILLCVCVGYMWPSRGLLPCQYVGLGASPLLC
jgi:hypothetical protein